MASKHRKGSVIFLSIKLFTIKYFNIPTPLLQLKDNSGKKFTLLFSLDLHINRDDNDIMPIVLGLDNMSNQWRPQDTGSSY